MWGRKPTFSTGRSSKQRRATQPEYCSGAVVLMAYSEKRPMLGFCGLDIETFHQDSIANRFFNRLESIEAGDSASD